MSTNKHSYRRILLYMIYYNIVPCPILITHENTHKIENFISWFTVMYITLLWLTIIGVDYSKNKHHYNLKIHDSSKSKNGKIIRTFSFFNLCLTIFNFLIMHFFRSVWVFLLFLPFLHVFLNYVRVSVLIIVSSIPLHFLLAGHQA